MTAKNETQISDLRDFLTRPRIRGYHYRKTLTTQPTDSNGTKWEDYGGPFVELREHFGSASHWIPDERTRELGRLDSARLDRIFQRCTRDALRRWIIRISPRTFIGIQYAHSHLVTIAHNLANARLYPRIETKDSRE